MKKRIKRLVWMLLVFLVLSPTVKAACDATEENKLRALAYNVKASYEPGQGEEIVKDDGFNLPDGLTEDRYEQEKKKEESIEEWKKRQESQTPSYINLPMNKQEYEEFWNTPFYEDVIKVYITNITEDLYVKVSDKLSGQTKTYQYSDTDKGTLTIVQDDIFSINNYTIEVYSSAKTSCPDTKLYTLYQATPMFNVISTYDICQGAEDFYLCHEYLSVEPQVTESYDTLILQYKEGKINEDGDPSKPDEKEKKTFGEFVKKHKGIFIGTGIGIVIVGGAVAVIIVRKQRSKRI